MAANAPAFSIVHIKASMHTGVRTVMERTGIFASTECCKAGSNRSYERMSKQLTGDKSLSEVLAVDQFVEVEHLFPTHV